MTPNQYIITEEQLTDIEDGDLTLQQLKEIRSHPYNPQAEREKMLEELCKSCQYGEEMPDDSCFDCVVGVQRIELRKGGEWG